MNTTNQTLEIVNGEISRFQDCYYLSWECPETGKEMWCQGEFFYNKKTEEFEHDVTDEDCNLLYKVTAK